MLNIKDQLNSTPHKKLLMTIGSLSEELSIPSYIVGGYIRDLILKRETTEAINRAKEVEKQKALEEKRKQ